jgi:hypothetical protein
MSNADELKGSIVGGKGDCKDNCRDENKVADREHVRRIELELEDNCYYGGGMKLVGCDEGPEGIVRTDGNGHGFRVHEERLAMTYSSWEKEDVALMLNEEMTLLGPSCCTHHHPPPRNHRHFP